MIRSYSYWVSEKKRKLFDFEYLKDAPVKLIVLLVRYLLLPYNSIKPNFSFLWLSEAYDFQVFYLYNKMESFFFHIITSLSLSFWFKNVLKLP